jgi:hypothetical protein
MFAVPSREYVIDALITFEIIINGVTTYATMGAGGFPEFNYPSGPSPIAVDFQGEINSGPGIFILLFSITTLVTDDVRVTVSGNDAKIVFELYNNDNPAASITDNIIYTCLVSVGGSGSNSGSGSGDNGGGVDPEYPYISYNYTLNDGYELMYPDKDNKLTFEFVNHTPQFDIPTIRVSTESASIDIVPSMEANGKFIIELPVPSVPGYMLNNRYTGVYFKIEVINDPYNGQYWWVGETTYNTYVTAIMAGQSYATLEASVDGVSWPESLKYNLCVGELGDVLIKTSSGVEISASSIKPSDGGNYYFRINSTVLTGYEFSILNRAMAPIAITAQASEVFVFNSICTFSRESFGSFGSLKIAKQNDDTDTAVLYNFYAERAMLRLSTSAASADLVLTTEYISGKVGRIFGPLDFYFGLTGVSSSALTVKALNVRSSDVTAAGARFSSTDISYNAGSGLYTAMANYAATATHNPYVDGNWNPSGVATYWPVYLVAQITNPYNPVEDLYLYSTGLRYEVKP